MSTFLSMFDPGVTRGPALMPHRCKYCPRFFHRFHQLRCHIRTHQKVYKKHQGLHSSRLTQNYLSRKFKSLNGVSEPIGTKSSSNFKYYQQSAIKTDNRVLFKQYDEDKMLFNQNGSTDIKHVKSPNRDDFKYVPSEKDQKWAEEEKINCAVKIKREICDNDAVKVEYRNGEVNKMIKQEICDDFKMETELKDFQNGFIPHKSCKSDLSLKQDLISFDLYLKSIDPSEYYFSSATPYRCIYCTKSFSKSSNRLIHQRAHLKDPFPWVCKECPKKFRSRVALEVHSRKHSGEKPYKCPYCESHFSTKGYLNVHVRGHTGERPFQCKYCQKSFLESCKLTIHLRTHTMEKPYKCRFCDNTFSQLGNCRKHERIHTGEKPYKCCHCDKEYTNFRNFHRHELKHTQVDPYKCDFCNISFKFRRSLKTHEKIHTGGSVFICALCNGAYSSNSNLKKHRKDVHYSRQQTD